MTEFLLNVAKGLGVLALFVVPLVVLTWLMENVPYFEAALGVIAFILLLAGCGAMV